jgi:acyl carrier protein
MFEQLRDVISKTLKVDPVQITESTAFKDLDVDSLALVELAMELEDAFGVPIGDAEMQGLGSVGDVLSLVRQRSVASG